MDFPLFHLDFIGNRMLVAITAITHVIVNHPMAVGAIPLATLLEWRAWRNNNAGLDELARKITFVFFVITTSLGAMTGVGIWFTTSLVNPDAIGSLLRVFFWGWFIEWIVFVLEVIFIMIYFLTWKKLGHTGKKGHIITGAALALFSWLTMAIITGILGFMMHSGSWQPYFWQWSEQSSMFAAFFNPLYFPQLWFRTPLALMTAGLFFLFLVPFFTRKNDQVRAPAVRMLSLWTIIWLPFAVLAGLWYWNRIPAYLAEQTPVAVTTQAYTSWYQTILVLLVIMVVAIIAVSAFGMLKPRRLPRLALIVPFVFAMALLGYFERVREFIRKPYIIQNYMYANGFRIQDYPLLKQDGVLKHATYVTHHTVTEENKVAAGKDVFMLTCSRCHTVSGINSVTQKFDDLFPNRAWQPQQLSAYMANMHNVRPFMPPFPGSDAERDALAEFIVDVQYRPIRLEGAQSAAPVKQP
ncbi:cytochrome c [candidate division KSB1 bacterium]|nr:cytochrome c [candidate division KSB1 bacterium]